MICCAGWYWKTDWPADLGAGRDCLPGCGLSGYDAARSSRSIQFTIASTIRFQISRRSHSEMEEQLLETWNVHNRINLYLLDAVDPKSLADVSASKGRTA